jgi:uncharacterized membrane protein YbhN (UPF0104 family)/tRNA A-37 threonylcarbamoyl transferase component Bud32
MPHPPTTARLGLGPTPEDDADRLAGIEIVDTPAVRVHHPSDLLGVVVASLGVALMLVLATYAQNTTTGVAEDVQGFGSLLRQLLIFPVTVLEIVVTVLAPVAVLTELAVRRLGRQVLETLIAAVGALLLALVLTWALHVFGPDELISGMSVRLHGEWTLTVPPYAALVSGLLTTAGPRTRRRTVAWSWNLLWVWVGVVLITGQVSLPGLTVSLLAGRIAGLGVRYLSGVRSERAYGVGLVDGVRRAGFEPVRLARVPDADTPGDHAAAEPTTTRSIARYSDHRVYDLTTADGQDLDVVVLDGDRQVVGMISRLWRSLRLRGLDGRSVVSLRQAAERAALLAYAARAAGVRTPRLVSIAEADDSMLLVQEAAGSARPLADLSPDEISDETLSEIWAQLHLAHAAGIAHRALTSDVVLVDSMVGRPVVWLVGWEQGDVASSELARRMDVMQLVAVLALRVGAARALESAATAFPDADIAAVGPLLQTIALPRRTRDEMRAHKEVLAELRSALVQRIPEADLEPEKLVRFGARTLVTIFLTIVAVVVVLTTINVDEITTALSESDWRWSVVSFALGLVTLVGAALAFVAFSPVRLPLMRATLVQSAATFVALAAPAGIGPAALNLRMLTRRGVSTSLAAATVALVQVSQFVVTILLLLGLSIASGTRQASPLPASPVVLVVVGAIAVLVASTLLVPAVRAWVARKTLPMLRQTWPRLIEVVGQPRRLALAFGGNVLMTMGYVLAFDAALQAFGQHVSLVQVAVLYLAGNTAGSLVPTPGGLGTVEFALATGLASVGTNAGVAISVAVLFRVLTFWLRIPIGWASMRYLQRRGEL